MTVLNEQQSPHNIRIKRGIISTTQDQRDYHIAECLQHNKAQYALDSIAAQVSSHIHFVLDECTWGDEDEDKQAVY